MAMSFDLNIFGKKLDESLNV